MKLPTGAIRAIYVTGVVLALLGITDVLLTRFANIDVTGYQATAYILGGVGIVLMQISRFIKPSDPPSDTSLE